MSEPEAPQTKLEVVKPNGDVTAKHPMAGTEIRIFVADDGKVAVTGPLNNTILCLELLKVTINTVMTIAQDMEKAKTAVLQLPGGIKIPGLPLPPVVKPN